MPTDKKSLLRTIQCAKCPWKKATDPYTIPNGYSLSRHQSLESTIQSELGPITDEIRVMACHHSTDLQEQICVGYLYNQLGEGNNIALRLHMRGYDNVKDLCIDGQQHSCFEDTLP